MSSDRIALCEPLFAGNEWTYVKECLDTAWVSSGGAYVGAFEQKIAAFVGAPHAVATVNGTSAIHVALLAAGVERGDEVLVSSMTFIAPANAIAYIGAFPIFVDADPHTWQMDPALVVAFLRDECELRPEGTFNQRTVINVLMSHNSGHKGFFSSSKNVHDEKASVLYCTSSYLPTWRSPR